METIVFDDISFTSQVWELISKVLEDKLAYNRTKLENAKNYEECVKYQANINTIKEILNLPNTRDLLGEANKLRQTKGED